MYKSFYKLNDRPFDLKPDPKYFFLTHLHKQAITQLCSSFEQRNGVRVLTGEIGIGKTSLISFMLDQLDKDDNIVACMQKPPQKDHDFLPAILTALQIPFTELQPKILFNTLHKFMLEQANLNKNILLVIDDAESLSNNHLEIIRLLSTLQHNDNSLIRIILAGSNDLKARLAADENHAIRQKIASIFTMQPLQISETRQYIEHRLMVAGSDRDPVIDESAFNALHLLTDGIPYKINHCCDRLLILCMIRESHQINDGDVTNLTPHTMQKLEVYESAWMEQDKEQVKHNESPEVNIPSPSQTVHKKEEPMSHTAKKIDIEKFTIDVPAKKSRGFFNKRTAIPIIAAYVASIFFVAVFVNPSEINLTTLMSMISPETQTGNSHDTNKASASASHNAPSHNSPSHNTPKNTSSHMSASVTHISESIPAAINTQSHDINGVSPIELLSIAHLSDRTLGPAPHFQNNQHIVSASIDTGHDIAKPVSNSEPMTPPSTIAGIIKSLASNPVKFSAHESNSVDSF